MRASHVAAFLLVASFATPSAAVTLPFGLTPKGGIIVPVNVNGVGGVLFLLDTGSTGSVISPALAARIGAKVVARTKLVSASGQKDAVVARIEQLTVGDVTTSGVLATIAATCDLNPPDVAASGQEVQGVIGQDVLAPLRYTIDYRARQIVWHGRAIEIPGQATVLELEPHNDRFLIRLPQKHGVVRLVPDTGADALVLFSKDGIAWPSLMNVGGLVGVTGLAGTRAARTVLLPSLRIGSTTLSNVAAVVVDGEAAAPLADGLLPLHRFRRVTFNGPERQLVIEEH
jgi:predicted aspartyl protease